MNEPAQEPLLLDEQDKQMLRHALGLDHARKPYRNGYSVDNGNAQGLYRWGRFVDAGLAQLYNRSASLTYFALTQAGAAAIGAKLPKDLA